MALLALAERGVRRSLRCAVESCTLMSISAAFYKWHQWATYSAYSDPTWSSLSNTSPNTYTEYLQCAMDAFGGRKTFLAVKGCYERNFVVFKQIYAFETFTANMHLHQNSNSNPNEAVDQEASSQRLRSENETERLREYERKIYSARKAGFHVGNLSSRILDHWHRMGWYTLFYDR